MASPSSWPVPRACLARVGIALGALLCASACAPAEPGPDRSGLRQPTGLAVSPEGSVLLVTNGNWDRRAAAGTLTLVDLEALQVAIDDPGAPGSARRCRRVSEDDETIECDPTAFIDLEDTVVLGDGVGNVAIDRPTGPDGPTQLLVPVRSPASLVWMDLVGGRVDCGQDDDGVCDARHRIVRSQGSAPVDLPGEPAQVTVAGDGTRFAYVPHLLGGALSLVALDGEAGPELADVEGAFYREDVFDDEELAGGFAVALRPCDPAMAPESTRGCERPLLYSSHRYFPGLRQFTVATGLDRIVGGDEVLLPETNVGVVDGRPFMADLEFEGEGSETLLAVQTTPPALLRLDTSLDAVGLPRNVVVGSVPLCSNPNAMAIHRPVQGEALALVACRSARALAVVALGSFRVVRIVDVGLGPSEVIVDSTRARAYVANTEDDTISIIGLDPAQPEYLREGARLGVDAGTREKPPLGP